MATEDFKYLLTDNTGQTIATAEQARNTTLTQIKDALGTFNSHMAAWAGALSSLTTGDKSSLVNAINWVLAKENTHESNKAMHDVYDYLDAASNGDNGAGIHNSLYRGKNLGESLTADQIARINDGTFKGLWLGDCWIKSITFNYWYPPTDTNGFAIDGDHTLKSATITTPFGIADHNYYRHTGDIYSSQHHITVIPRHALYSAPMKKKTSESAEDSTAGAYALSDMRTIYLQAATDIFNIIFGASHILNYREYLENTVTNGRVTSGSYYDCKVELMNEVQLLGHYVFDSSSTDGSNTFIPQRRENAKSQFAIYKANPELISYVQSCWLRNVVNDKYFANTHGNGSMTYHQASFITGVRPFANIY